MYADETAAQLVSILHFSVCTFHFKMRITVGINAKPITQFIQARFINISTKS